jgi:hypothetical protein
MRRITLRIISTCLIGFCAVAPAAGPGGPTDLLARLIAERMAATLGQAAIVKVD